MSPGHLSVGARPSPGLAPTAAPRCAALGAAPHLPSHAPTHHCGLCPTRPPRRASPTSARSRPTRILAMTLRASAPATKNPSASCCRGWLRAWEGILLPHLSPHLISRPPLAAPGSGPLPPTAHPCRAAELLILDLLSWKLHIVTPHATLHRLVTEVDRGGHLAADVKKVSHPLASTPRGLRCPGLADARHHATCSRPAFVLPVAARASDLITQDSPLIRGGAPPH